MKKWKIVLTIIVLLLAGGGGTLYYLLNVKDYKTADAKVAKIVENDYKINLPDVNDKAGANQHATNQSGAKEGPAAKIGVKTDRSQGNPNVTTVKFVKNAAAQKETASDIITAFQPSFQNLESQANSKLNSLLSYALDEYQAKKIKGEKISYFYFYSKYSHAAKTLEANTDASFNVIYNALVKDLQQSGYSESQAKPIENHYLSLKKQTSSAILNKAMAHLK